MTITLKQALSLTGDLKHDAEIIRLSWPTKNKHWTYTDEIISIRRVKEQYDLKALMVKHIEPVLRVSGYDGLRYVLATPRRAGLYLQLGSNGQYTLVDQDGRIKETGRTAGRTPRQLTQSLQAGYDLHIHMRPIP